MNRKNRVCFSILNILSYRSYYTALLPVLQRSKFCYYRLSKTLESDCSLWIFYIFLVCRSHICKMALSLRSGHLMCTYNISLFCQNTRNYFHFLLSSPWTVVTDVITDLLDTCSNIVHVMLNIEQQIEKIVLQLYKTIQ